MLHKEYCVYIYKDGTPTKRTYFCSWRFAVRYARSQTSMRDKYEIEMRRNGRFRYSTGVIVGGKQGRMPRRRFAI